MFYNSFKHVRVVFHSNGMLCIIDK